MNGTPSLDLILDALADRVAARIRAELKQQDNDSGASIRPRLLTVEQAATYLGRTKAGVQHLISEKALPVVRSDRRVFLDVQDLDRWIATHKQR